MPWWAGRTILFLFLAFVFLVFYIVTYSTILGIRANYRRYAQKSSLQWTGPGRKFGRSRLWTGIRLLVAALISAWIAVDWVIF